MVISHVAASVAIGQDGQAHASLEVIAESVSFLGGKNGANDAAAQRRTGRAGDPVLVPDDEKAQGSDGCPGPNGIEH